ncbi:PIR Superfamily Protein [Plasmodium ovale curtisi]|uniref:PIR Superfamily Protein n=1 Tax=Plasmodium ovale curtisi TaxID=864141 RepID=A0A1A8XC97_PLAOA|nr:PIR Superfamily Protein [Plasmodium ovale curtisi]SBT01916.1 PIR Superfamily Protein [Plasmodium ovale curtisi]
MPETTGDKGSTLWKEDDTLWKNSDLFKFYNKLDSVFKNGNEIYKECTKANADSVPNNCKIEENIKKKWEEFNTPVTGNKHCAYVVYWIYDKIMECKSNIYCTSWLYTHFENFWRNSSCCEEEEKIIKEQKVEKVKEKVKEKIEDKVEEIEIVKSEIKTVERRIKVCKNRLFKEFNINVINNRNELYRFLECFNNIKSTLQDTAPQKKKLYCKYIQEIFDLYDSMTEEDEKSAYKKYENVLTPFKNNFQHNNEYSGLKAVCKNLGLSEKEHFDKKKLEHLSQDNDKLFRPLTLRFYENVEEPPTSDMDVILKDTESYKLYKEFDKELTADNYNKYCTKFKDLGTIYKDKSEEICKKIVRNVKNIDTFQSNIKGNKRCLHYKNWVYEAIWKMFAEKKNYNIAGNIIKEFMNLQNDLVIELKKEICHYYFSFNDFIEVNVRKEEKDLYDYFENYDSIDKNVVPKATNDEKYNKYLQYMNKLYERRINDWDCCDKLSGVDPLCRHYFKCDEEYNPSDLLAILNGKDRNTIKNKYKKNPTVRIGERKVGEVVNEDDIMRIQYGRCSRIYDPDDKTKVISLRCDYQASLDHFKNFHEKLPYEKKKDNEKATTSTSVSHVNMSDLSGIANMEENESNPVSYKIPTSVALGIGTVFVFFLYYKFTPFGSLFGKRSGGKTNFQDDFHEEYMQAFPYHGSEYEDENPRKGRIQIAYQRA